MRLLIILSLVLLASCNGGGGGATSSGASDEVTASERLTLFEQNFKAEAETLEDSAVYRFNPCRDDLNWNKTGATSGDIEISGFTYSTANVTDIQKTGACSVEITPSAVAVRKSFSFTATGPKLTVNTDYTAIFLLQGGDLYFNSTSVVKPSMQQTEAATIAQMYVKEVSDATAYFQNVQARRNSTGVHESIGFAAFSVNKADAEVGIEHYNSVVGLISTTTNDHPSKAMGHAGEIDDLVVDGISAVKVNDSTGPLGMIIFDRLLTNDEHELMKCYALYLTTKDGDMSLWNRFHSDLCSL
jgi:hypothetical protein